MPTDLGVLRHRQAAASRLAGIGVGADGPRREGPMALQVVRRLVAPPVVLVAGAAVRTADAKGRIKPGLAQTLAALLGWEDGDLSCHLEAPWLVLTQSAEHRGAARHRNSSCAHLRTAGCERVCLAPAQAHAILGERRQIFLVPVPDARALVVCDPGAFLSGAPPSVAALFGATHCPASLHALPPSQTSAATTSSAPGAHRKGVS